MRKTLAVTAVILLTLPVSAQQPKLDKQRAPKPAEFALVFSFGYAGDKMPADDAQFEKLLTTIKADGFNVIHCTFTDKRLELCKKHGIKMMIDLLEEKHHIFRAPDKAEVLCKKLRDNPDVWGYNIWNDNFGKTTAGRQRDVTAVRQWDSTHPAYCGTYRTNGMGGLTNADIIGYYDFHWKRGPAKHFPHLLAFWKWSKDRDSWYYTWLSATSGQAGKGNFNRSLYSANTAIACGCQGILWFLATDLMDPKTLQWTERGRDIIKVHHEISSLSKELPKLGLPSAIYSTSITRTLNNEPIKDKKQTMPPGLEGHAFPKDAWIQPIQGEFALGFFTAADKGHAIFVANHNAYAVQKVALKLTQPARASFFDRAEGKWQPLLVRDGVISFRLDAGGGELIRLEKE